jgi:PmbA protein
LDIREVAERLLELIDRSGADEGEVYLKRSEGLEISLRDQAVERLRNKDEGGYALRIMKDARMAFVHSSDFREDSLRRTVGKGVELARAVSPDDSNVLPGVSGSEVAVDTYDPAFDEIAFERKVSLLKDAETLAFAYDPCISKIEDVGYEDSRTETVVANSHGVFRHGRSTSFSFWTGVVAERDGEVESGGEHSRSSRFDGLDLPSKVAKRACWKAKSLLGGRSLPTQTCPVIFDPDTGHALLSHLFAMARGDNIVQGLSALKERLGERIGSDMVTIVDDPTLEGGVGSRSFDGEGVPSQRTVIVDRGILNSFLFDTRSALKAGFKTTGNARREGFRDVPSVGFTNLFLDKGIVRPEDIIGSTGRGLWVISLAGWWVGINPSTGDFSSGAKGLWVEDGQVAHPVQNITIASNVLEMLAVIDAVGDDLDFRGATASPTFRLSEMKVGGV